MIRIQHRLATYHGKHLSELSRIELIACRKSIIYVAKYKFRLFGISKRLIEELRWDIADIIFVQGLIFEKRKHERT